MNGQWGVFPARQCGNTEQYNLGPVSQRLAINRTVDINRSSMANRVELAINRNLRLIATLYETGPRSTTTRSNGEKKHTSCCYM